MNELFVAHNVMTRFEDLVHLSICVPCLSVCCDHDALKADVRTAVFQ
jgi:hypothetical protein